MRAAQSGQLMASILLSLFSVFWLWASNLMRPWWSMPLDTHMDWIGFQEVLGQPQISESIHWFAMIASATILFCTFLLWVSPGRKHVWGLVIIAFSLINILTGMGGFLAGLMGMFAGAIAIQAKT